MEGILGIELKNVLVSKGQAHDKISAKIFMDNRKIAQLINDGWCDEYYIEFINNKTKNEFEERMIKYYKDKKIKIINCDCFIEELLFINHTYKSVKYSNLNCEQLTFL